MMLRSLTLALCASLALPAVAQETIIRAHGFATYPDTLKYGPDFEHLDYVNPDAPKGGEMSTWARGTFDSMNPYTRKGRAGVLSTIGFERIMTSVDDDAYGSYCLLCESLEYPESQDWVIFHLRPEARFADGTPLTAHDIVFTVNLFLEQGLPSYREAVKKLYQSVEALDDHTVKFTFAEGVPRKALIHQAGSSIAFPRHWFEETGAMLDESRLEIPPGSGAYQLDSLDVNRQIVYARDPDYWGKDLPINRGRYNFDTIRIEYFADERASLEGFKSGAYLFRQETSSLDWATAYDFPAVRDGHVVKAELPDGSLPTSNGFAFNLRRDKLQDRRVREALALMFNFTWTNNELQYGLFEQRHSYWENSDLAADGVPEGAELALLESVADQIDPAILSEPARMAHESGERQLDRRNYRRASELMDEAGWIAGDDGIRRKDGQTLDIEFLGNSSNSSLTRIIEPYIANLNQLGVNASYNRVDPAQYTTLERDHDYDMIYDFYRNSLEEALGISQRFGCEDAEYSLFNPAGFCSAAVDTLIEGLRQVETLEDMKVHLRAIDRIMRHELFMVPTWYNPNHWVAYWDIYDHPDPLPPYDLAYLDAWWYDAEAHAQLRAAGALR